MYMGITKHGPSRKIDKVALVYPCMKFEFFWSQMTLFEVVKNRFPLKVPLVPFKWMKVDEWDYFNFHSQDFLSLFSFNSNYFLIMKPLSVEAPHLLVIQIQIQAV